MTLIKHTAATLEPVRPEDSGQSAYERFRAEPATALLAVVDEDRRPIGLLERNSYFLRMASEYGRALYASRPISILMDDAPLVVEADREIADFTTLALTDRGGDLMRGFIVVEDGRYYGVGTARSLLEATNAETVRAAAELRDLARILAEAKAAAERDKLFTDTIVEHIPAMLCVKDVADNRFILVNRAAEKTTGRSRDQLIGFTSQDVFGNVEADVLDAQDRMVMESGGVLVCEEQPLSRPDGSQRILRTKKLAICDETGAATHLLVVAEDITERKEAEARIERMAHYDGLTDLANRAMFHNELDAALAIAGRTGERAAVMCLDLDHFKAVNDTLGHACGDQLLKAVAERLRASLPREALLARLGGDEFAVLQTGVGALEDAARLADAIVEAASAPFEIAGREVVIGASVGVALFPEDGAEGGDLLKKADMALYRVKSQGRGAHHFFQREMDDRLQARRALELDLRRALGQGEFELHYQPFLELEHDRISGCEALLRWNHPTRGLVGPVEFIPLAEEIGLIGTLGEWVLRTACAEAASWPDGMRVAVNVSPVQFRNRALVQTVASALASAGLAAERLELEITESVLLSEDASNLKSLHQLRALGCRISLDDFGTGYSSLSYLRAFPFDKIKIDRSFVQDLPHDADSMAIVRAVTGLSASLGMTTTAEGVETPEQLAQLRQDGCTEVQGYLIGRPCPAEDIRRRLELEHGAQAKAA